MHRTSVVPRLRLSFSYVVLTLTFLAIGVTTVNITVNAFVRISNNIPIIKDPTLKAEIVFEGLKLPTGMAFLGPNDILVLEKDNGTVQRIVNGTMLPNPLLDVNVAIRSERGMESIAIVKNRSSSAIFVFLYYTETEKKDGEDRSSGKDLGNRLYRYELVNNKLVDPKLLLDVPSKPCCIHNGGKITIGPDDNVYVVVGDANGHRTKAQNYKNGKDPDGTSAIYRITQDGKAVVPSILGNKEHLSKYYAYGIRNSFGLDFDPVTRNLWDTENGPGFGDEINLVKPGFNSGWAKVHGIWNPNPLGPNAAGKKVSSNPDGLVDFSGKGNYSPPEFTWRDTVGPTALIFLDSDKLGKQYENDLFVGDFHQGFIYHFDLNKNRNNLLLEGLLNDKVADKRIELQNVTFAHGFSGITDLKVGPDGYLYVLDYGGQIWRIVPIVSTNILG